MTNKDFKRLRDLVFDCLENTSEIEMFNNLMEMNDILYAEEINRIEKKAKQVQKRWENKIKKVAP